MVPGEEPRLGAGLAVRGSRTELVGIFCARKRGGGVFLREFPPMSLDQLELKVGYQALFDAVLAHFWAYPPRDRRIVAETSGMEFAVLASFIHSAPLGGNYRQYGVAFWPRSGTHGTQGSSQKADFLGETPPDRVDLRRILQQELF
jgi:hypothetical protein